MTEITFIAADGSSTEALGQTGETLMEVGRRHGVAGIIAECGGSMACATCHVVVDENWFASVGAPGPDEEAMLEIGVEDPQPTSRLSCQITVTDALDGLTVTVPTD